ncbi:hypothetical protein BDC45DRAFT_542099 [Circinella umbellata]|nr:hypothetical protein BDC45DRAFT_542099 [Circinella umbellata]
MASAQRVKPRKTMADTKTLFFDTARSIQVDLYSGTTDSDMASAQRVKPRKTMADTKTLFFDTARSIQVDLYSGTTDSDMASAQRVICVGHVIESIAKAIIIFFYLYGGLGKAEALDEDKIMIDSMFCLSAWYTMQLIQLHMLISILVSSSSTWKFPISSGDTSNKHQFNLLPDN